MPRPQRELDPNGGALVAFARELRALREQAGSPKFATMERRVGRSKSTLADAAGGQRLPRWDTVADFVRACGADPAPWRPRWEQLRRELGMSSSDEEAPAPIGDPSGSDPTVPEVPVVPTPVETPPAGAGIEDSAATPPAAPPAPVVAVDTNGDAVPSKLEGGGPDGAHRERATRSRWVSRRVLIAAAAAAIVFGPAGVVVGRATGPEVAGPYVRAIEVQNKVALGSNLLVEDGTPAYLSSSPIAYCAASDRNCKVAGTEMGSGAGVVAHCTTHGQQMYNFNLNEAAAASNPDRVTSDLWYRATFPDGRTGFISEVYLGGSSRGGLGLPDCGPGLPAPVPAASVR